MIQINIPQSPYVSGIQGTQQVVENKLQATNKDKSEKEAKDKTKSVNNVEKAYSSTGSNYSKLIDILI
jgi:hypothetical protein